MKTITATDANRHFSRLLREVAAGATVTIVLHGRPVAVVTPLRNKDAPRLAAKHALLTRLRRAKPSGRRTWTGDELYDDA